MHTSNTKKNQQVVFIYVCAHTYSNVCVPIIIKEKDTLKSGEVGRIPGTVARMGWREERKGESDVILFELKQSGGACL